MPAADTSNLDFPTVELMSYDEDQGHLVYNKPEPEGRSQVLKLRSHGRVWWIRVTFKGTIYQLKNQDNPKKKKFERRKEFQEFIKSINYSPVSLLDDTMTEIVLVLSREPVNLIKVENTSARINSNIFIHYVRYFDFKIHEDPKRVVYPPYSKYSSLCSVDISQISVETEINDGRVFRVRLRPSKDKDYIYKTIDRPFYHPMDTEVIQTELENLKCVGNYSNIVQLAGVVVSVNPYMTSQQSDESPVIMGILLEFYGGGSLQHIIDSHCLEQYNWQNLVVQIGTALGRLHDIGRTHMDIKPSNIVLDLEGNAILIDISGMGVTYSWLSPEMKDEELAIDKPFRARLLNDIWTYGKLLFEIAIHIDSNPFAIHMQRIAKELMKEDPVSRMSLVEAITQLREARL